MSDETTNARALAERLLPNEHGPGVFTDHKHAMRFSDTGKRVSEDVIEALARAYLAAEADRAALREALSKVCIAAAYYGGEYVEREVDAVLNATLAPSKDDANATS